MTSFRKIIFPILLGFVLLAKGAAPLGTPRRVLATADTSILNDSSGIAATSSDPRREFKDLFIANSGESYAVQLNPRAISFVHDYMERHTRQLQDMKDWGKPYFDIMDKILTTYGLPGELKYLAVIESNLKTNALSWAGAVGPWQFMTGTARELGLRVGQHIDDRRDYYKSTAAAARYLADLFSIYGDWLLVIAAYNGGVAHVNSAIKKSGSHDFWNLQYYLPEESRNHVKKFIATHYIMEGNGGITTVTKAEAEDLEISLQRNNLTEAEVADSKTQNITGKYNSTIISKYVAMDVAGFNRYNPDFDRQIGSNGRFELRLPTDKMEVFNSRKYQILEESMRLLLAPLGPHGR